MTKQEKLKNLEQKILKENPCKNLAKTANRLVFGSGNPDAEIVLVGEAPGKNEDLKGQPFVGASGRVLDELLSSIQLDRGDVYITNIVKYRPPENRDPTTVEKQEFMPYLLDQLRIIKPKIVATLGRHSGQAFAKGLHISADHGKPRTMYINQSDELVEELPERINGTFIILPLYHPAAALYNGSLRTTLTQDFQLVNKLLKS